MGLKRKRALKKSLNIEEFLLGPGNLDTTSQRKYRSVSSLGLRGFQVTVSRIYYRSLTAVL